MEEKIMNICENVYLHILDKDKFKTSFVAAFYVSDLVKENITINALIPAVLTRGTEKLPTMKEINLKLDELYGASLDGSSDKIGDKQALQFYITTIDDKYALEDEKLLEKSISILLDVIYHPKLVNGIFDTKYVEQEKENLKELIKARINEKSQYAISRCVEEMYKGLPYGEYKYGNIEDLEKINAENLYEQYQKILAESEVHFYVASGAEFDAKLFEIAKEYITDKKVVCSSKEEKRNYEVKEVIEKQEVTQGKIVLGYDVNVDAKNDLYKMQVYNAILGGSSNSKMFQNVREKESLAYTARSSYLKHKCTLIVFAGIEIEQYDKALATIEKQVEDMRQGNFSDEDIKDAKVFLKNIMLSYEDSQDMLIDLSMGQWLIGMQDTIPEMIEKMEQVTREDIIEVANRVTLNTKYFLTGNH